MTEWLINIFNKDKTNIKKENLLYFDTSIQKIEQKLQQLIGMDVGVLDEEYISENKELYDFIASDKDKEDPYIYYHRLINFYSVTIDMSIDIINLCKE